VVIGLVANKVDLVEEDDRRNGYGRFSNSTFQDNLYFDPAKNQ
jgi:hypothetical protein